MFGFVRMCNGGGYVVTLVLEQISNVAISGAYLLRFLWCLFYSEGLYDLNQVPKILLKVKETYDQFYRHLKKFTK